MTPDVIALRARLESVQRAEPLHTRVYGKEGVAFCRRCPSRRECRNASLTLAEAETRVIGGDHA